MRGGWRAHGCGPALRVHLVVDQSPLFQEGMDPAGQYRHCSHYDLTDSYNLGLKDYVTHRELDPPHDRTHISCQVPAAGGGGQVLLRVESVGVNHKVPVRQVTKRRKKVRLPVLTFRNQSVQCSD